MPRAPKTPQMPRIKIEENSANDLYLFFSSLLLEGPAVAILSAEAIIEEGKRFAQNQEGQRYQNLISQGIPWKTNRLFWILAEIDTFFSENGIESVVAWEIAKKYADRLLQESGDSLARLFKLVIEGEENKEGVRDSQDRLSYFLLGLASLARRLLSISPVPRDPQSDEADESLSGTEEECNTSRKTEGMTSPKKHNSSLLR